VRIHGVLLATVLALTACSAGDDQPDPAAQSAASSPTPRPSGPTTATPTPASSAPSEPPSPRARRVRHLGIDASHHQGAIDWQAVAGDGISFAYLKATEGTSYTDPTFARHRAEALDLGLRVGGYHYFQLCSSGAEQAAHFAAVVGDLRAGNLLPGAVDLELAGSCSTPPPRDVLLTEVRTFLDEVEAATGKRPVVYLFPELEARYGFADELDDHRQWVRSLDGRPDRPWWIWQRTDSGTVSGIAGPVDVNVMWRREVPAR
jgi:lysozyme